MEHIEKLVKEYSSKKLQEITGSQSSAYSERFIDFAKDELIRRGESFVLLPGLTSRLEAISDEELKNIVEADWKEYHLEFLEAARLEYIRRGFRNESRYDMEPVARTKDHELREKYPALKAIRGVYTFYGWFTGIILALSGVYNYFETKNVLLTTSVISVGILVLLLCVGAAESIKVIVDIERNTRRSENE
jgi:hypothetical protein